MVSRCFRRAILSVTATTILVGQQILAKTAIAQAQASLDPPVQPAKWYSYQQPYEIEGVTVHSNAISACKAYESEYKINDIQYRVKFQRVGVYPSGYDIPYVNCVMKLEPNGGDEYEQPMDIRCPNASDVFNPYVYTGGTNGECRLANNPPDYKDTPSSGIKTNPIRLIGGPWLTILLEVITPTEIGAEPFPPLASEEAEQTPETPSSNDEITENTEGSQQKEKNKDIADKIANGHAWDKHKGEFPEVKDQEEFKEKIENILNNPQTKVKKLPRGRTGYYDESSNTVVVHTPQTPDSGTAFKPKDGFDYFKNDLR